MKNRNYFFCIIFLFVLLFTFTFSFYNYTNAYSLNISDFRTYSYKLNSDNEELNKIVDYLTSTDYYFSGSYYYFAYYSASNNKYVGALIPKENFSGSASLSSLSSANGLYVCNLILSGTSIRSNIIPYNFYSAAINNYVNEFGLSVAISDVDYSNRICYVSFSTDYPFDITYPDVNGNTIFFLHNSPYISDNDYTISNLNGSYFLIYPNNSSIENLHFSLCKTESVSEGDLTYDRETVLADFSLDYSSPYYNCPLGDEVWFEVPYSDFPSSLTINKGEEYNWRLQYDLYGDTYYVNRYIVSLVDYSFTGSSRW